MENKRTTDIRHIGQKNLASTHPVDLVGPFGNNEAASFIYKKVEKLSVAIHLVSNTISEREPIRLCLRNTTLTLLSDTMGLQDGFRSGGPERTNNVLALLVRIMSLLEIANASGYLSSMNLEVLRQECINLGQFVREVEDTAVAEALVFGEDYFKTSPFKGHNKDSMSYSDNKSAGVPTQDFHKGQSEGRSKAARSELPKKKDVPSIRHAGRRVKIVKLIQGRGRISVKDIVGVVDNCSEKTLQRELSMLVKKGVLKKEGERRWSTYTLAQGA